MITTVSRATIEVGHKKRRNSPGVQGGKRADHATVHRIPATARCQGREAKKKKNKSDTYRKANGCGKTIVQRNNAPGQEIKNKKGGKKGEKNGGKNAFSNGNYRGRCLRALSIKKKKKKRKRMNATRCHTGGGLSILAGGHTEAQKTVGERRGKKVSQGKRGGGGRTCGERTSLKKQGRTRKRSSSKGKKE